MAYWWVDRVLPGVVVALVSAPVALLVQHRAFSRKMRKITQDQTGELKRHISGGGSGTP